MVLPGDAEEVAAVVAWCYEHDVRDRAARRRHRASRAAPCRGRRRRAGLERMTRVRAFEPLLWRMQVEAGVTTADVRRLARENGLFFPPDPGAAEQSQIGGNIATNAGGPHAFKYGVTGAWVTGLEAVVPPGEIVAVGGPIRKDVAGYDLKGLLIGSEGTLGVDHRGLAAAAAGARGRAARGRASTPARERAARRSRRCSAAGCSRRRARVPRRGRARRGRRARSRAASPTAPASW